MKRELLRRLDHISARQNGPAHRRIAPQQRMTREELEAELNSIKAKHDEEESRLRSTLSEEAYHELLAQRKRDYEERMARVALIEIKPEWNEYGFDITTLNDDELFAVLLQMSREMLPDENQTPH